jgi:hypothetical protein
MLENKIPLDQNKFAQKETTEAKKDPEIESDGPGPSSIQEEDFSLSQDHEDLNHFGENKDFSRKNTDQRETEYVPSKLNGVDLEEVSAIRATAQAQIERLIVSIF